MVPVEVATTISARLKLLLWSMGAGAGCDAQYLFACDILASHKKHMPRHSKVYRNFAAEFDRLQAERIAAFREFAADVEPAPIRKSGIWSECRPKNLTSSRTPYHGYFVDEPKL